MRKKIIYGVLAILISLGSMSVFAAGCTANLACGYTAVTFQDKLFLYYNGNLVGSHTCYAGDKTWEIKYNCKKDPAMMQ